MQTTKNRLVELQTTISKLPMDVCVSHVVPEFRVHWRQVSRLIKNSRLPMQPSSVARVLCRHAVKTTTDDLDFILRQLRLTLAAVQLRVWHVLRLQDPTTNEPDVELPRTVPQRVLNALRNTKFGGKTPEVHSITMGDLLFLSIQFVSAVKRSTLLYLAAPLGQPVVLISHFCSAKILKACAEGLGYASYENANLHGKDKASLLRIADNAWNANADHLTDIPPYEPTPVVLPNGIDYTHRTYDEQYIDTVVGPDPPLLTDFKYTITRKFYDSSLLRKSIRITLTIKSDDLSRTLKKWALMGVISPSSKFFHIFTRMKTNMVEDTNEDSESDD